MLTDDADRFEVGRLLRDVSDSHRQLTEIELHIILNYVSAAGFDSTAGETARRPLEGEIWRGQRLTAKSRLPPEVRHWLLHARIRQEWPDGTMQQHYVESLRQVILDPDSGIFVNHY